jgi:hypothetical protein
MSAAAQTLKAGALDPVSGAVHYALLGVFVLMPVLVARR